MIITIDGPAGSGKSTAARNLAKQLEIAFLDTGATYRATTLRALRENVELANEAAMADCAARLELRMLRRGDDVAVFDAGEDISLAIRTEAVSANARYAAKPPAVRQVLVALQREMGRQLGTFVTEGRDQGTVVFPDAEFKFYMVASGEVRAKRRVEQLAEQGETADFDAVLKNILDRDESDFSRKVGPLKQADNAIVINTDLNTPEQTIEQMLAHIQGRNNNKT